MPVWGTVLLSVGTLILGAFLKDALDKRRQKCERKVKKSDELIQSLQNENKELKSRIEVFEAVEVVPNADYYKLKATGQAICPVCWGKSKTPIPVRDNGTGYYLCSNCKAAGYSTKMQIRRVEAEQNAQHESIKRYINCNG